MQTKCHVATKSQPQTKPVDLPASPLLVGAIYTYHCHRIITQPKYKLNQGYD